MRMLHRDECGQVSGGLVEYENTLPPDDQAVKAHDFFAGALLEASGQPVQNTQGFTWAELAAGAALVGLGLTIIGTAGLATVPIAVIVGAGTAGELIVAGTGLTLATGGGAVIGNSLR